MIELDKCMGMECDFFSDVSDSLIEEWCRHWESHPGFQKLDKITGSSGEMSKLTDVLETIDRQTSTLVEQPALEEFELIISESVLSVEMTVVRFKKTVLPRKPLRMYGSDGFYMEYVPYIDAYLSFRNSTEVDSVMTIFSFHGYESDGKERISGTATRNCWSNRDPMVRKQFDSRLRELMEVQRNIKLIYLAIQNAMYDKPVVFAESIQRTVCKSGNSSRKHKHRNRVRVIKTIRLVPEELKKYAEPQKHMGCPCWGVIGHWRTYKSGKQVWIAPYKKGKERGNPSAYNPKDYVMEDTSCS